MTVPAYTVTRKRMKTMRIRVQVPHGPVAVSAPHWYSDAAIEAFVKEKADWIRASQARLAAMPPRIEPGPEADRLRRDLAEAARPLVAYWADRMGLEAPTLGVRIMRTRWGTCNVQRRHVTLALELANCDEAMLEYVIVHELAHLIAPNHGPEFKAVMDRYLPEWRELRRALRNRDVG